MKIPLHLKPSDRSQEALNKRLHMWQRLYELVGGKGFRQPPKNGKGKTYFQKLTDEFMAGSNS